MMPISLSRGRYTVHAFANGKDLGRRNFTTVKGPMFQPKHYERVKDDPDQRPPWFPPPDPIPIVPMETTKRRKFLWIF